MRKLLLAFVLVFFSSLVFAQSFNFTNGSFETGDTNHWDITFPMTVGTGSICGAPSSIHDNIGVATDWASDGSKSLRLQVNSFGFNHCTQILNNVNNDFNGNLRALVDYNSALAGSNAYIRFYQKGISRCTTNLSSGVISTASCVLDPTVNDYNMAFVVSSGGATNLQDLRLDNFRWQHVPIIKTDTTPFTNDVFSNDQFTITVDYNALGSSCSVKDVNTGISYAAPHVSGTTFRTNPMSFTVPDANVSISKSFSVTCDGIQNSDPSWSIKLNRDNLLSNNGSFETSCTGSSCMYAGPTQMSPDWNVLSEQVQLVQNTYAYQSPLTAPSGYYLAKLISDGDGNTSELRSNVLLNGGTVYYDLPYHDMGSLLTYRIDYIYAAGGQTTLFGPITLTSNIMGQDKSIAIPNVDGYISFRFTNSYSGTPFSLWLDNVRYRTPRTSGATLCKPVYQNGDTAKKIDLVFVGSGFTDANQFKSTIEFATNYNGDQNGLFSFEPFKSNRSKFNVWMVDQYKTYNLHQDGKNWEFGDDVKQDAYNCPFANEIVLLSVNPRFTSHVIANIKSNSPTGIGTHVAYVSLGCETLGTCSYPADLNILNPYDSNCQGDGNIYNGSCWWDANNSSEKQRILPHEMGHSFSGLWDEYYTGAITTSDSGGLANCDHINTCPKWVPGVSGATCNQVCGYSNWYRAYDTNTLMGGQVGPRLEYKTVNENKISSDINAYPTANFADLLNSFFTFVIKITKSGNSLTLNSGVINSGIAPEVVQPSNSSYHLALTSDTNDLYDYNFDIPAHLLYELPSKLDANGNNIVTDINSLVALGDATYYLVVPYFATGKKVDIYDQNNNLILDINLSRFIFQTNYLTGYGTGSLSSASYKLKYSLISQPTGVLTSNNYKVQLGTSGND